jgi:translation initiation factor IF-1
MVIKIENSFGMQVLKMFVQSSTLTSIIKDISIGLHSINIKQTSFVLFKIRISAHKNSLISFAERIYSRKISLNAQDTITFEVRDTTLKKASIEKEYLI